MVGSVDVPVAEAIVNRPVHVADDAFPPSVNWRK